VLKNHNLELYNRHLLHLLETMTFENKLYSHSKIQNLYSDINLYAGCFTVLHNKQNVFVKWPIKARILYNN
jgi:hypothetical protein